ncbi:hypothetical protein ACLMOX_12315 [Prevotella histicola]
MNVDEILSSAINNLMDKRLDVAIELLEQLYVQRPTLIGHSELEAVKNDYQLMVDYMERGFTDDNKGLSLSLTPPTSLSRCSRFGDQLAL